MQGTIKTYLSEKRYGFIKGNDGKDYFFHESSFKKSDIRSLAENILIEFDQVATPKGYQAKKCKVLTVLEEMKYATPSDFLITKQGHVKGWDTLETTAWFVTATQKNQPIRQKIYSLGELSALVQTRLLIYDTTKVRLAGLRTQGKGHITMLFITILDE